MLRFAIDILDVPIQVAQRRDSLIFQIGQHTLTDLVFMDLPLSVRRMETTNFSIV